MTAPFPPTKVWKRAQRAAEAARDFALLFEGVRTAADRGPGWRDQTQRAAAAGDALAAEIADMAGFLRLLGAHPPAPKAPPSKPFHEREDDAA